MEIVTSPYPGPEGGGPPGQDHVVVRDGEIVRGAHAAAPSR